MDAQQCRLTVVWTLAVWTLSGVDTQRCGHAAETRTIHRTVPCFVKFKENKHSPPMKTQANFNYVIKTYVKVKPMLNKHRVQLIT